MADEIPDYIEPMSDEMLWARLRLRFSELCEFVTWMRLETKEEAVGAPTGELNKKGSAEWEDKTPRWFDDETGKGVRAWGMIPYVHGVDQKRIQDCIDQAEALIGPLENAFASQRLNVKFLHQWGRFSTAAGVVEFIYFGEPHVGGARSAKAGGDPGKLDRHKQWFARYFLRIYRRGQMDLCRDTMEKFINAIIKGKLAVPRDQRAWFESFLNMKKPSDVHEGLKALTGEFRDDLTVTDMNRLAALPVDGLNWLDLDFPYP